VHNNPKNWKKWLRSYNSTYHASLGSTPFRALYGVEPQLGVLPTIVQLPDSEGGRFIAQRQLQLEKLKEHLANAQNYMKMQADKHMSEKSFKW
jgi:hypothetical protein